MTNHKSRTAKPIVQLVFLGFFPSARLCVNSTCRWTDSSDRVRLEGGLNTQESKGLPTLEVAEPWEDKNPKYLLNYWVQEDFLVPFISKHLSFMFNLFLFLAKRQKQKHKQKKNLEIEIICNWLLPNSIFYHKFRLADCPGDSLYIKSSMPCALFPNIPEIPAAMSWVGSGIMYSHPFTLLMLWTRGQWTTIPRLWQKKIYMGVFSPRAAWHR